jgi:stalled ribosome rescue protein Dom34
MPFRFWRRKKEEKPKIVRRRWTAEEEGKLREMFEQGMPFAAMCSQLNRSYAAILVRASKLGLKRRVRKEGVSKRIKSEEEIRKRIQELDAEIEEIKRNPSKDMIVLCAKIAERDALRWVLGEQAVWMPVRERCIICGETRELVEEQGERTVWRIVKEGDGTFPGFHIYLPEEVKKGEELER